MSTEVTVTEGQIRIESVDVVIDEDDVKVFEIDCRSKYPRAHASSIGLGDDERLAVILLADEHTLRAEAGDETVVTLPVRGDSWTILVSSHGKYIIRVAVWRYDQGGRTQIWPPVRRGAR